RPPRPRGIFRRCGVAGLGDRVPYDPTLPRWRILPHAEPAGPASAYAGRTLACRFPLTDVNAVLKCATAAEGRVSDALGAKTVLLLDSREREKPVAGTRLALKLLWPSFVI